MIRTLRALFLTRLLREKVMVVSLLGLAVILWGAGYSSRAGAFWRAQKATADALRDQDMWLARQGEIETATRKAASQMDPSQTLDLTNLNVTVTQLASEVGVHLSSAGASAAPFSAGQFSINAQKFQVMNTDWHAFAVFYQRLQEKAPYVAITELAMTPVRGNPSQIMATVGVASFEIKH
jgi:hypothetical protein